MTITHKNYPSRDDFTVKMVDPITQEVYIAEELPLPDPSDSNNVDTFRANADVREV